MGISFSLLGLLLIMVIGLLVIFNYFFKNKHLPIWIPSSAVFVITIKAGEVIVNRGQLSTRFISAVASICQDCQIQSGQIMGIRDQGRVKLRFSADIPKAFHQRFRNVWNFHKG